MIYAFDDCLLDTDRRELRRREALVAIEPQAFDLLELLIRNRHRVVHRDEMIAEVWRGRIVSESTLSSRMTTLRQAVGDDGVLQRLIRTVPRKGVRFVGEVQEAQVRNLAEPRGVELNRFRPPLSIVVLPFSNLSSQPDQDYLAEGIVADITTDLTRLEESFVIARNTALTYKNKSITTQEIGRELGVRYALEGSVRRVGDTIRINTQLVDAETGGHLWAEAFDGDVGSLMALSEEVTLRVGRALKVNLINAASRRANKREAPTAVDLVLRGRAVMNRRITRENLAEARSLFRKALEIAPHSIDALVGIGVANVQEHGNFLTPPDGFELLENAEKVLNHALDHEPNVALGRYGRAFLFSIRKQLHAARFEAQFAITLDRTLTPAYIRLAQIETALGNPEEALRLTAQALRISPKEPRAGSALYAASHAHMILGNDEQAVDFARRSVNAGLKTYFVYSYLAAGLANLGRLDEARDAVNEMRTVTPEITLARVYANRRSDESVYLTKWQRYLDGLRMAGLPEG